MTYRRVIAHSDFDGIASASLCLLMHGSLDLFFTGPIEINLRKFQVYETDIIVDLPYGSPAGLWYDHHVGNTEDVTLLGVDTAAIPGTRQEYPSCAGLIYDTHKDTFAFPAHIPDLITGVNRVDSFDYKDIDDWRTETPDRIIDLALKSEFDGRQEANAFMRSLTQRLKERPVTEIIKDADVAQYYRRSRDAEEKMLGMIDRFLKPLDPADPRFLLLDFSEWKAPVRVHRSLAFLRQPTAHAVISVSPIFKNGVKTTDLKISMSLAIGAPQVYDLGDMVRTLNIGDGHKGSASGKIEGNGKADMLKKKDETLRFILETMRKAK